MGGSIGNVGLCRGSLIGRGDLVGAGGNCGEFPGNSETEV